MATDATIIDKAIQSVSSETEEVSEGKQIEASPCEGKNCVVETKLESEDNPDTSNEQIVLNDNLEGNPVRKINSKVYNFLKNLLENSESATPIETELDAALQFLTTSELQAENLPQRLIQNLIEIAPQFIRFPNPDETPLVQQYFSNLGERKHHLGFPNVLGAIACTHIQISTPPTRPEIYLNRSSNHSINVQIVCGPDLQIYNVLAAFPGGMEDACIWQCSNLRQVFSESSENNGWLIGDSNYPQEPWIMTPLNNAKSPGEKLYNKIHYRTWRAVKNCIEVLRSRFSCLQTVLKFEPKKVCGIVTACCVLHNICIQLGDDIKIDPVLKQARSVDNRQTITVDSMEEGVTARDHLIQNYFSK